MQENSDRDIGRALVQLLWFSTERFHNHCSRDVMAGTINDHHIVNERNTTTLKVSPHSMIARIRTSYLLKGLTAAVTEPPSN